MVTTDDKNQVILGTATVLDVDAAADDGILFTRQHDCLVVAHIVPSQLRTTLLRHIDLQADLHQGERIGCDDLAGF